MRPKKTGGQVTINRNRYRRRLEWKWRY